MPLRRRMAVATALAVGVAVIVAAVVAYAAVRGALRGEVDRQLTEQADLVLRVESGPRPALGLRMRDDVAIPAPSVRRGGSAAYVQLVSPDGRPQRLGPGATIAVDGDVRAVADGGAPEFLGDATVGGDHVRVLTAPLAGGGALQLARSLESVDPCWRGCGWCCWRSSPAASRSPRCSAGSPPATSSRRSCA